MKFNILLTWSKIVAVLILGCGVYLDVLNEGISAFMFCLPFVMVMITGKQFLDKNNGNKN